MGSDVDDTLFSSGGSFPAGCDKTYPKHVVYPGCLAFFCCLDSSWREDEPSCNLVFLSARPHVFKDVAEEKSYKVFNCMVADGRMHSLPTLLPGKLISGIWATVAVKCLGLRAWRSVGEDKFSTYCQFVKLYPEYDFVFCGDDGQGDLLAGQHMLLEDSGPPCRAVCIHKVLEHGEQALTDECFSDADISSDDDGLIPRNKLIFHRSYLGAALELHLLDPRLLSKDQVVEIAEAAVADMDTARLTYPEWADSPEGAEAERHMRADWARTQKLWQDTTLPFFKTSTALDRESR